MGEVYRATDSKLGREVAIKLIPEDFAKDATRMARFTREAQVLASLNHPNIAAIYGVEDRALIMELVEGPTLSERIKQGAIPLDEALEIARQIADGARSRARQGHRPPRSQAGQHQDHAGRHGQAARLRPGQGRRPVDHERVDGGRADASPSRRPARA